MKIWLTHSQKTMLARAAGQTGTWVFEHDGCRDALEEMQRYRLVEVKHTPGISGIAFRVPTGRVIVESGNYYSAV